MSFAVFLQREFERRRARNPRYSLRAFAAALQTDHASLSQILRGQRAVTDNTVGRLGSALGLSTPAQQRAAELAEDDYRVLDTIRDGEASSPHIAAMLGISTDRVNVALHRLLRLGLARMHGATWAAIDEGRA